MAASTASSTLHPPPPPPPASSTRSISSTTATKPAHVALHRRLLFPHLPASSPVPPLLVHASPTLNTELYALLALALRAHITPWWSKLTRYDREFVPQVASILGHVLRVLEARVLAADVTDVLFRALPVVLTQHYADYRAAEAKVGTSYAAGGAMEVAQLFHQLQGHMAVDAEGRIDPSYVRHTLDHILEVCLPAEDYESDAEHAIVREVIVKVVMDNIVPLLVQPWFVHKLLLDIFCRPGAEKMVQQQQQTPPASKGTTSGTWRGSGPSFHTVVVFVLSSVQYLSGVCLAMIQLYKQTVHTIAAVNASGAAKGEAAGTATEPEESEGYGACMLNLVATMMTLEKRSTTRALLVLLEILSRAFSSFSDRLVRYGTHKYVLNEDTVLAAVRAAKETLYPNGYPGPPPRIPTVEEQRMMKEKVISQVIEGLPGWAAGVLLGPNSSAARGTVEDGLAPLSSPACNAHLLVLLLDVMVVALFPELAVPAVVVANAGRESCAPSVVSQASSSSSSRGESRERGRESSVRSEA